MLSFFKKIFSGPQAHSHAHDHKQGGCCGGHHHVAEEKSASHASSGGCCGGHGHQKDAHDHKDGCCH